MAKIAYLVLAHNRPDELIETLGVLTAQGDYAVVHFDLNASNESFRKLTAAFAGSQTVLFAKRRRCGWGGWSLVGATLDMVRLAEAVFEDATHFYLISGSCAPIKSRAQIEKTLVDDPRDVIEVHDLIRSDWIKTGMKEDRFRYRHYFNERRRPKLFYGSLNAQRRMGWRREQPKGIEMKIGSQWWCLRRKTIEQILSFVDQNPSVVRFFKTTWIPDECFFQSVVARLVPVKQITGAPPTLLMFTDYGVPVVFYADHFDFLKRQPGFFGRKISEKSPALRSTLNAHYATGSDLETKIADPRQHYKMVAGVGRTGDRFGARIWDRNMSVPRSKNLIIVSAKRWDEGDWLRRAISDETGIPSVGYLFNTNNAELPDLGGLEAYVDKRARHRRAVTRLLFDSFQSDQMVIGLDPESTEILDDLARDRCSVSVIFVDRNLDEVYFKGHALRTGQISADATETEWQVMHRALRERYERCVGELQHPGLNRYAELRQSDTSGRRAEILASTLDCDGKTAAKILTKSQVFKEAENA